MAQGAAEEAKAAEAALGAAQALSRRAMRNADAAPLRSAARQGQALGTPAALEAVQGARLVTPWRAAPTAGLYCGQVCGHFLG